MDTNITASKVEVFFASPESSTVTIQTPSVTSGTAAFVQTSDSLAAKEVGSQVLEAAVKLSGSKRSFNVLNVKGSEGISVFGMHNGDAGCDG